MSRLNKVAKITPDQLITLNSAGTVSSDTTQIDTMYLESQDSWSVWYNANTSTTLQLKDNCYYHFILRWNGTTTMLYDFGIVRLTPKFPNSSYQYLTAGFIVNTGYAVKLVIQRVSANNYTFRTYHTTSTTISSLSYISSSSSYSIMYKRVNL